MNVSISTRVTACLTVLVFIMVLLAIVTALTFYKSTKSVTQITQDQLPALTSVFGLVLESERMSSMAPDIIVAQNGFVRQALNKDFIQQTEDWEKRVVLVQEGFGNVPRLENLVDLSRMLHGNINDLSEVINAKMSIEDRISQIVARIQRLGERINSESSDDDLLNETVSERLLFQRINHNSILLLAASSSSRFGKLHLLKKRYDEMNRLALVAESILENNKLQRLKAVGSELNDFAQGKDNLFELSEQRLVLEKRIEDLLVANTFVSKQIDLNTEGTLAGISEHVTKITQAIAEQLSFANRISFLFPILGGVFSFIIIFYLRRSVVGRILALQTAIQQQLDGGTVAIPVVGNDEISQMGRATKFYINEIQLREQELRNSRDELELRVERRTLKINSQNRLLRQEIQERGTVETALRESENRLKFLSGKLIAAQEEERRRLAAELHDNIGPSLGAIKFGVENAVGASGNPEQQDETLHAVVGAVKDVARNVGRLQMELRPSIIDDLGVLDAIDWYCSEYMKIYRHIEVIQVIHTREEFIPEILKIVLYRIIQESLNNVAKHSGANTIKLHIETEEESFALKIEDNGCGISEQILTSAETPEGRKGQGHRGLGLVSMRERVELTEGQFSIESGEWRGTKIYCSWHQCVTTNF